MDVERARATIAAEKPRRLRLDEMLRELGARVEEVPEAASDAAPQIVAAGSGAENVAAKTARRDDRGDGARNDERGDGARNDERGDGARNDDRGDGARRDAVRTDDRRDRARRESISVGELVDRAAESGFGFLVGVLALIAIPFFGLSTPFGLAIALVGVQPAIGRARPWLPKRMRGRELKMTMLDRVLGLLSRRLGWLARSTRRRWEPFITPRLVGLAITLLGLGLALPLPIPGSNMIFIIPIIIYAIGLLERDGVWIVVAHVCTLVDLALVIAFGEVVVRVLERVWHWIV